MSLMHNVLIFVSEYTNYNKKVIRTTSYNKVIQRLAFWLLTSMNDQNIYKLPGTQEVFADILLTNRSTLNQELQKLREMDAIHLKGKTIKVKNPELLEEIINKN